MSTPEEWAQAVRDHQRCLAEWDAREAASPGVAQTFHAADAHLPRTPVSGSATSPEAFVPAGRHGMGDDREWDVDPRDALHDRWLEDVDDDALRASRRRR